MKNEESTGKRLSKYYKTYTYITRIDNMLKLKQEVHLKAKSTTKGLADNIVKLKIGIHKKNHNPTLLSSKKKKQ